MANTLENTEAASSITSQEDRILTMLSTPGTRAVLVSMDDGQFKMTAIAYGESVLNIPKDLLSHLDDYPHSNEFLEVLSNHCIGRLAARQDAKAMGGISIPMDGSWVPTMFFR
jgi:hypothetical protein